MIGSDCNGFDEILALADNEEEEEALWNFCGTLGSRMGGYPCFIQFPPEFYEDGTAEILLLQIDTDDGEGTCGIMFGDCRKLSVYDFKGRFIEKRFFKRILRLGLRLKEVFFMEFPKELEKFREKLESTYKPCNEIKFVPSETKPWESKIGGCPYLEKVEDYPKDENGNPMFFMAQINLEEMPPLEDFPTKGILQFYVVDDDDYGLEDPCKVIYIEEYSKDESKLLTKNPFEDKYIMEYPLFEKSGKAVFTQNREMIGYACNGFDEIRAMIDEEKRKKRLFGFLRQVRQ